MNPLAGHFPTLVKIGGRRYPLRWDFLSCAPIIMAYEDPDLTPGERQSILLSRLYKELPPDKAGQKKALSFGLYFLDGGEEEQSREDPEEGEGLVLYSLTRDGSLIYSTIRSQYGVDLQGEQPVHWWAFLAMFRDLDPESRFCTILRLREKWLTGKLSREEAQLFDQMGASALPPPQPGDAEAEAYAQAFLDALEGGGDHGG